MVKRKYNIALLLIIAVAWLVPQKITAQVSGRVTDSIQQPIPQVNIIIKKTERGTQTDAQGKYDIFAKTGDTLIFSHIGRQPVEVRVERSPSEINVEMPWMNIEIEGVEIKKAKRKHGYKSQKELLAEYPTNKKLIKTAWLIIDKDLSSTFFRIVDGNDLILVGPNFLHSLQDHFPQMRVAYGLEGAEVYLRGYMTDSTTPIFDVDGFIQTSPPTYLSANDIDRVALLERGAAIARYGPQGAAGVIVVNTKAQTWMDDMGVIRTYDNRSLADSLLREVTLLEPYRPHESFFMDELQKAKTEKEALDIYEGQKELHRKNPSYFIEAYDFFLSRWGNEEKSFELIGSIMDDFSDDVPVLKALAYLHQKYGQNEDALNIYLEILKLQYDLAQSHRDVANAYAEVGDFKKAMEFYTNIQFGGQLTSTPFDAYGDDLLITTEMENMLERNKVDFPEYKDMVSAMNHSENRTRLVFEWNNLEAEFELQFVAPDGYFDTWSNKAVQGYSCKQFFIDQENKGVWQVNIDYKYKQSEVPTYLKVSVYHDYGLTSQHVDIKVYQLSESHEKVQLFMLHEN